MKDYWVQAYKEFFYLGLFGVFLNVVAFVFWVTGGELIREAVKEVGDTIIFAWLLLPIATIVWLSLGLAFKNKKKWAIKFGYILVGLTTLFSLYPLSLIGILMSAYFLWVIRRAQKQDVALVGSNEDGNESGNKKWRNRIGVILLILVISVILGFVFLEDETDKLPGFSLLETTEVAEQLSKTLPTEVDSETLLIAITGVENGYIYEYKLINLKKAELDLGFIEVDLFNIIKNETCVSPDTELFRIHDSVNTYRYFDTDDIFAGEFMIYFSEC